MRDNKTEKSILQAAEEEFLLKGFAGARTTEIAQRAGVNHAMLHYYFKTKEQLFEQVLMEKLTLFQQSMLSVLEFSDKSILENIADAMSHHFDFLLQNPMLPRFLINEVIVRPEYVEKVKAKMLPFAGNALDLVQRALDESAQKGEICQVDALTLLLDMVSLNLFVFIAHPIFVQMQPVFGDLAAFYAKRKKENIEVIVKRLKPDTPCKEPSTCNEQYY